MSDSKELLFMVGLPVLCVVLLLLACCYAGYSRRAGWGTVGPGEELTSTELHALLVQQEQQDQQQQQQQQHDEEEGKHEEDETEEAEAKAVIRARNRVQIIDVRTGCEVRRGRIGTARNSTMRNVSLLCCPCTFRRRLRAALLQHKFSKQRRVVVVCKSAHRSIAGVRVLRQLGYEHAVQLQRGTDAWHAHKLPVTKE
jgi:SulP family sulfate permease